MRDEENTGHTVRDKHAITSSSLPQTNKQTNKKTVNLYILSIKVGLLPSIKSLFYLLKPFKNNEKYFLFHPKSTFRSQNI